MLEADKVFAGSVPENYDRYMVPLIFDFYANDIAQQAASFSPKAVLEIAAGTGVVTRALAPKLAADAAYVVTDLNPAMLDYAASRQPPDSRIQWKQADAMALPFDDAAFDLACCQFGAMFFPDRTSGYREVKRVLKPGGRFLFNVWDRIEENVFAQDVLDALGEIFPDDPPRFITRTPHGYFDTGLIRSQLEEAGFSDVAIETKAEQSRAPLARIVATAFCQGTPIRNEIEARGGNLEAITDRVAATIAERRGSGEISAKMQAHVIKANA
ncbi:MULTISPECIES: class I SAM-dependent methyltransferase [Mesorhizobium]|uniref:Methyltransferase domain-containing protein n=1 Tax=Mesorhizobium denitrificans TaxID=2294114 RepID=A0A371XGT3_9HYPH|nr:MULTISPECIES: class I SAM-dependent methyltransferase [Mesorhizobium]RFC68437.1 methyltransferase domain-containing protein [Mesorhizobium denitrificans]